MASAPWKTLKISSAQVLWTWRPPAPSVSSQKPRTSLSLRGDVKGKVTLPRFTEGQTKPCLQHPHNHVHMVPVMYRLWHPETEGKSQVSGHSAPVASSRMAALFTPSLSGFSMTVALSALTYHPRGQCAPSSVPGSPGGDSRLILQVHSHPSWW